MDVAKKGLILYPGDLLLKEIILIYWSDIMAFYNFLSKEVYYPSLIKILALLEYYRLLPPKISL